jgi:LPXTG-motif cell wall-anchored protein
MKALKKITALFMLTLMSVPFLFAQDGTYIENLNVPDSTYLNQDVLAAGETSGSGTIVIIIVAVVVIAAAAFFILRKKKK